MRKTNLTALRFPYPLALLLGWFLIAASARAQSSPVGNSSAERSDDPNDGRSRGLALALEIAEDNSASVSADFDSRLQQKYNLADVISSAFHCPLRDVRLSQGYEEGQMFLSAGCDNRLSHSGTLLRGVIGSRPIRDLQSRERDLEVTVVVMVPQRGVLHCDPPPDQLPESLGDTCIFQLRNSSRFSGDLRFEYGYTPRHAAFTLGVLGFLLAVPFGMTLWFRTHARTAPEERRPAVWFAYWRFLHWTALFGSLLWWAAADLLRADEFVEFFLSPAKWSDPFAQVMFTWILLWTPPVVVYFVCLGVGAPIQRLRGTSITRRQALRRSFWAVARFVFPVVFISFGVMELFHSPRLGVVLVALSFLTGRIATRRFVRAYGIEVHALSTGELRDRAFALAEKANAKLNQLYVLPAESMRLANAFAHASQNVLLTDYLVKNLGKAEIDAVVAHEIAHLQKKHVNRRAVLFSVATAAFVSNVSGHWLPPQFPAGPVFYGLAFLGALFISRRNEHAADAGSARLTGNAEAMITALARLSRLNMMPLQWAKLDEKLLSHPSTSRRIKRLAADSGISEARTSELLEQCLLPPAETYSIPATALPAGKIFSTCCKAEMNVRFAWTIIFITLLLPAIFGLIVNAANLQGAAMWSVYLLGVLVTLLVNLGLLNFLPMMGLDRLEWALREKHRAETLGINDAAAVFVSLSPDASPRVYEGNWAWDLGLLWLTGEQLVYWGEETRFSLRREEIASLAIGPGPTSWFSTSAVYLSWRDLTGKENILNLRPMHTRSMGEMGALTRRLARDLQNWHAGLPASADALVNPVDSGKQTLAGPNISQVTSRPADSLMRGALLARDFLVNTFLAVAVIVVLGLGFPMIDDLTSSPSPTQPHQPYGGLYVLLVVWLTRLFVFIPYWKKSSEPVSTLTAEIPAATLR